MGAQIQQKIDVVSNEEELIIQDNEEEIGPVDDDEEIAFGQDISPVPDNIQEEYDCGDEPEEDDSQDPADDQEDFDDVDEEEEEEEKPVEKSKVSTAATDDHNKFMRKIQQSGERDKVKRKMSKKGTKVHKNVKIGEGYDEETQIILEK